LSPKSIALRFFSSFPDRDRAVRWATEVDHHRYGLVATSADGRVVAHAGWEREPDRPERAEVAFAIADAMGRLNRPPSTISPGVADEGGPSTGSGSARRTPT
jgi:hypothetical protein